VTQHTLARGTHPPPAAEPRRYAGWQPEKSGFIGGLSLAGFCFTATAVVVLLVPVYRSSWDILLLAGPVAALLLALAYVRVSGLSADEWLPRAVRHCWNTLRRRNTFASGVFAPARSDEGADDPGSTDSGQAQPMDLPGTLASTRILTAPTGTGTGTGAGSGAGSGAAVVHDPLANTYSAIIRVHPPGLALADLDRQHQRVHSWGALLAGLCVEDGSLTRIGVCERSLPDDGTALRGWTDQHTVADAPTGAVAVLEELMAGAGPSANARDTFITLTLDATRARGKVKAAGGGDLGACAVLMRELTALRPAISAAELRIEAVLAPRELAEVIRTAYDPHATEPLASRRHHARFNGHDIGHDTGHDTGTSASRTSSAGHGGDNGATGLAAGVDPALAGPAAAESGWSSYRHDGAWTVTYQVRDWPRAAVYPTVLQPLMKPKPHARRTFTLLCEPLGPRRAERELSRERTKRQTLISLRRRTGRVDSPDEVRELSRAETQDQARAAGHGVCRFTALVAVTVTHREDLDEACAELEADAAMSRIELRRLWGAQDSGFAACCLPLGHGLPNRRAAL
jgi:type VII ESX secretion system EccE translocon-like protein